MTAYTTKDSGARAAYDSGMVRDTNEGKARFDLCHPLALPYEDQMLTRFAMLMARGAKKYGDRNWELGNSEEELARARESAARHFEQWLARSASALSPASRGLDDGEDHAAAVFFNVMAAEYFAWMLAEDDDDEPDEPASFNALDMDPVPYWPVAGDAEYRAA